MRRQYIARSLRIFPGSHLVGEQTQLLSVVPAPFLNLGDCHAEFLAYGYLFCVVPDGALLEMLQENLDLAGVFLLFIADSLLDVLVVPLLDPETGHRKVGLCLWCRRLGNVVVGWALDACSAVELILFLVIF